MKNIYITFDDGDAVLMHSTNADINKVKEFFEIKKLGYSDMYELKDEDIQFHPVNERLFVEPCEKNILKNLY